MANKKTTKREFYELIKSKLADNADIVAFCDHEIELLDNRKRSADGEKKLTPKQIENLEILNAILDNMEVDTYYTISDMQRTIEVCKDLANQKISALLRMALNDGTVVRTEEKGKALFSLAKVKG